MSQFKSYRKESKTDWGAYEDRNLTISEINCGALLRIADATEIMAQRYRELIDERNRWKQAYDEQAAYAGHLERKVAGLRGTITKQRAVIAELGLRAK